MGRTADMFAELKPPRAKPQKLMHVCDAAGCCEEDGSGAMVRMECPRCHHETEWLAFRTVTEAKRGIPCPRCNVTSTARHNRPAEAGGRSEPDSEAVGRSG